MALLTEEPGITGLARARGRSGIRCLGALIALFLWAVPGRQAGAADAPTREYLVKAAFLFNFTQFVEWPAAAFPDDAAPIRLGILGEDPFGRAIDDTVQGETVRNRPLVVVRSRRADELKDCHLVFVARSERSRLDEVAEAFDQAPVLTVSDCDGFTRLGGMIGFFLDGAKVRFEINPSEALSHGLKLSAQLLSLGRLVGPEIGAPPR
ncbi:MAG: YfiR family protein [Planctomycetes bacterium]|nr:YfiR family protein [Planctomycetota bacterium]